MHFMVSTRKMMPFSNHTVMDMESLGSQGIWHGSSCYLNLCVEHPTIKDKALWGWTTSPSNPTTFKTLMLNICSTFPDPNYIFEIYFEVKMDLSFDFRMPGDRVVRSVRAKSVSPMSFVYLIDCIFCFVAQRQSSRVTFPGLNPLAHLTHLTHSHPASAQRLAFPGLLPTRYKITPICRQHADCAKMYQNR